MADTMIYADARKCISEWSFSDPATNKKGGKSVFIFRGANPGQLVSPSIQLTKDTDPKLKTPFGITKYDESSTSTRCNLDFTLHCKELEEFFNEVDAFLPQVAFERCADWFKKNLTMQEIQSMYKPIVTTSEKYPAMIRTKINTDTKSTNAVRVWKVTGNKNGRCTYCEGGVEDVVKGASFWANVSITGMYFLARLFGCTLTTTDILVFPQAKQGIPFLTGIPLEKEEEALDEVDEDAVMDHAEIVHAA